MGGEEQNVGGEAQNAGGAAQNAGGADDYAARRARMVEDQLVRRGVRDRDVLAAMRAVPRHLFVSDDLRHAAYDDTPLPIGFGQTISQPFMVARMTELLHVNVRSRVLDIGAGSGYQSAVLAELAGDVFAVERIPALAEQARERLTKLGYRNVQVLAGDGTAGWPEHAPYDGIMVAAAAAEVPPALIDQLAEGGRLVIPLGPTHGEQVLTVYERRDGDVRVERTLHCRFVPLVGARQRDAWSRDHEDDASDGPGDEGPRAPRWDEVGP
ncbi:MAG TPA: protein-L-isoaspartate(D-aspartate) O-methyltransferase [Thermoleophilia bacterium]|nr:protein-L-isoaspartate(D-aspartate) O-methyltransferase [Thermoleophilia bacterium]HQG02994.1 protein-L-isoaspartate(D-aspartate) O-methyltransferase [Thermoleophilia bacterium]HQG54320.1 protein-L-isoaspartate(D-aspartate) O-methyltransferase [Thermoleophilia bacterium]HQJ98178.1 protein-L-isoaspartate(D-aspartate) O-methyltransferase [Thermoleophilia bacterium]